MQNLTPVQRRALAGIKNYGDAGYYSHGASAHGGLTGVLVFLRKHGLIRSTEAGALELTDTGVTAENTGQFNPWHPYTSKHELKSDVLSLAKMQIKDKLEEYEHELGRGCFSAGYETELQESIATLKLKQQRLKLFKF